VFNNSRIRSCRAQPIQVSIDQGLTIPLAPSPLSILLKLVAFHDRKAAKDLGGALHCLELYQERRYGLDHDDHTVPLDYTCAYLVGLDGRAFNDPPLCEAVCVMLDRFNGPDGGLVGIVAREKRRVLMQDDDR
jgi:hypothetical protein